MPHFKPYTPLPLARVAMLHVNRAGEPVSLADLQAMFCEPEDAKPVAVSLVRLAQRGDLSRREVDRAPHYAPAGFDWAAWERRRAAGRAVWVGPVAEPRHINVMHAPVYRPAPFVPARPGATAAAAMPSRGHRC